MSSGGMIVGFDVTKRNALAVVLDGDGRPVDDDLDRLELPPGLNETEALNTLMQDAAQHFRRLSPSLVAIVDTTRTNNWALNDLRPRVQMETAIQLAAVSAGCDAQRISAHDAAKPLGVSGYDLSKGVLSQVDLSRYTYAQRRAQAIGAAWYAAALDPRGLR